MIDRTLLIRVKLIGNQYLLRGSDDHSHQPLSGRKPASWSWK